MAGDTAEASRLQALGRAHGAHNYHPLPVVIAEADGSWVTDVSGRRYLDLLAAYSAINFGHRHPRLVAAAQQQLERVTLVSRAFEHDQFGPFCAELAALAGMEMVLPMNTGAEAVETAIKTARKWGYDVKGVRDGEAVIVAFDGNFHGRTTTIISFSTDDDARASFGPYTPGFRVVPYGDSEALAAAMDERVVGVLVEPIQGEAGVIVAPAGFLARARAIADAHGALLWFDEVQSGMGRTGHWLASSPSGVNPDIITLAKGLGGGFPIGACIGLGRAASLFEPGNHGTTFGGNPPACAAALAVISAIESEGLLERATVLGQKLRDSLAVDPRVSEVSGEGLLIGIVLAGVDSAAVARAALAHGFILNNATPNRVRLAPPLVLTDDDVAAFLAAWPDILDAATNAEAHG